MQQKSTHWALLERGAAQPLPSASLQQASGGREGGCRRAVVWMHAVAQARQHSRLTAAMHKAPQRLCLRPHSGCV
jgi:hypothetical protein